MVKRKGIRNLIKKELNCLYGYMQDIHYKTVQLEANMYPEKLDKVGINESLLLRNQD